MAYEKLIVNHLRPLLQQLLPDLPDGDLVVISYQAIDKAGSFQDLLDDTARGHALFQYGGTERDDGSDSARLIIERALVWHLVWGADDDQQPRVQPPRKHVREGSSVMMNLSSLVSSSSSSSSSLLAAPSGSNFSNSSVSFPSPFFTSLPPSASSLLLSSSTEPGFASSTDLGFFTLDYSFGSQALAISIAVVFFSIVFSLPPVVTVTSTVSLVNGQSIITTVTGTTDSVGVVIPVSTLSSAQASQSAQALAAELTSLSSVVGVLATNTADQAQATSAIAALKQAQSGKHMQFPSCTMLSFRGLPSVIHDLIHKPLIVLPVH